MSYQQVPQHPYPPPPPPPGYGSTYPSPSAPPPPPYEGYPPPPAAYPYPAPQQPAPGAIKVTSVKVILRLRFHHLKPSLTRSTIVSIITATIRPAVPLSCKAVSQCSAAAGCWSAAFKLLLDFSLICGWFMVILNVPHILSSVRDLYYLVVRGGCDLHVVEIEVACFLKSVNMS
ncbi:hypothetical protein NMG60_11006899 [Bertholletia excelsa]